MYYYKNVNSKKYFLLHSPIVHPKSVGLVMFKCSSYLHSGKFVDKCQLSALLRACHIKWFAIF